VKSIASEIPREDAVPMLEALEKFIAELERVAAKTAADAQIDFPKVDSS
jgi:hypothetical protein